MFRPFSEPAPERALPPIPTDLPFDEILALDRQLGVEYPEPTPE